MAVLNTQQVSLAGVNPAFVAADALGDEWANSGRSYLHVKNGAAAAVDVTVDSQTQCNQGFDHNVAVNVPAASERRIGPFPKSRFDDAAGRVHVAYSAVANVTVAVVEVP